MTSWCRPSSRCLGRRAKTQAVFEEGLNGRHIVGLHCIESGVPCGQGHDGELGQLRVADRRVVLR